MKKNMLITNMESEEIKKRVEKICGWLEIPVPNYPMTLGRLGEVLTYLHFKLKARKISYGCLFTYKEPYDFLVDGKRIEVKTSLPRNGKYRFTFEKNRKNGINNFDIVMLVLLETIHSEPTLVLINGESIGTRTGISGTMKSIYKRFI